MVFSKNWVRNHPPFLLHFLIHIDVLMLCRKFELIPTNNFQVMAVFKNEPILQPLQFKTFNLATPQY